MDAEKQELIDKLEQCKISIENSLFNTRVGATKISKDTLERQSIDNSIISHEKTYTKLIEIIDLLKTNSEPPMAQLKVVIENLMRTVALQEKTTRDIVQKLFKEK